MVYVESPRDFRANFSLSTQRFLSGFLSVDLNLQVRSQLIKPCHSALACSTGYLF